MSDPERLLRASGDAFERELLESLKRPGPPTEVREAIWSGASAQLSPLATLGAKVALPVTLGALGAAGLGLAVWLSQPPEKPAQPLAPASPAVVTTVPVREAPPTVVPSSAPVVSAAPPPPTAARERAPVSASPAASQERAEQLRAEADAIREARASLRQGDAAAALAKLQAIERQVPGGALVQERQRLHIEALLQAGQRAQAQARARAFAHRYPGSPHLEQLERLGLLP